ncbi:MAG: flagellin [Gemmatimonadales bacterium]|nr:flagellin [Gemmatimonadales bacterium]
MSSIQTNVAANSAYRNLTATSRALEKQITKLSSGFRINRSADDAAGLAIANKLRAESRSLLQAGRNASQAISMLQVADGAIGTVGAILDRMKELASQSNSDNIGSQRGKLQSEFNELRAEIQRIAVTTKYQGSGLVDGTFGSTLDLATGTVDNVVGVADVIISGTQAGTYTITSPAAGSLTMNNGAGVTQTISNAGGAQTLNFSVFGVSIRTVAGYVADSGVGTVVVTGGTGKFMVSSSGSYAANDLVSVSSVKLTTDATGLNLDTLDLNTAASAQTALTRLDTAIDTVNTAIGTIGAAQSRMEFASANVAIVTQNVMAAESTIRDADMALETTAFTKNQILQQAGTAMLAQANQSAQTVLTLLR